MKLNDLYDISVLFDSKLGAKTAWTRAVKTTAAETNIAEDSLNALGWFRGEPLPLDILDTRLVGPSFTTGTAFVALKLGITGQHQIRTMFTNPKTGESAYPDPWKENALQRVASLLIFKLLGAGGRAVVLHKAGAVVKSADQVRAELGDLSDPTRRPYLAWLDTTTNEDANGVTTCRSHGLLHYFGAPDLRASISNTDEASVESARQAVLAACERIAGNNENPFTLGAVGEWSSRFHENDYVIELWPPGVTPPPKTGLLTKMFGDQG